MYHGPSVLGLNSKRSARLYPVSIAGTPFSQTALDANRAAKSDNLFCSFFRLSHP
jgi:hypothetical protein